jgi:hypothetical protein
LLPRLVRPLLPNAVEDQYNKSENGGNYNQRQPWRLHHGFETPLMYQPDTTQNAPKENHHQKQANRLNHSAENTHTTENGLQPYSAVVRPDGTLQKSDRGVSVLADGPRKIERLHRGLRKASVDVAMAFHGCAGHGPGKRHECVKMRVGPRLCPRCAAS